MVSRKNRLKKGIKSIQEQIEAHQNKKEKAIEEGRVERADYYRKEIASLEKTKQKKEAQEKKS